MGWKGNEWQPTLDEGLAHFTADKYGQELAETLDDLSDVVNGTRSDMVAKLRQWVEENRDELEGGRSDAVQEVLYLLDPYTPKGSAEVAFERTDLRQEWGHE